MHLLPMSRLVTHAEVSALPDGGTLFLDPEDQLTPLAEERAQARGIHISRGGAEALPQEGSVQFVEELVRRVVERLGPGAVPTDLDRCTSMLEQERRRVRRRAVVTSTGRNRPGIVARVTAIIAEQGGDILDISQTLVGEYFTMILVVDTAALSSSFEQFKAALLDASRELGVQMMVMHEDIVTSLQRV